MSWTLEIGGGAGLSRSTSFSKGGKLWLITSPCESTLQYNGTLDSRSFIKIVGETEADDRLLHFLISFRVAIPATKIRISPPSAIEIVLIMKIVFAENSLRIVVASVVFVFVFVGVKVVLFSVVVVVVFVVGRCFGVVVGCFVVVVVVIVGNLVCFGFDVIGFDVVGFDVVGFDVSGFDVIGFDVMTVIGFGFGVDGFGVEVVVVFGRVKSGGRVKPPVGSTRSGSSVGQKKASQDPAIIASRATITVFFSIFKC